MSAIPEPTVARSPVFTSKSAGHTLVEGNVIRMFDGSFHFVQYVNSSGAYVVPLAAISRDIKGHTITFTHGGRTISTNAIVETVSPLLMGGNSPEYQRYVRMARALREDKGKVVDMAGKRKGAPLAEFDTNPIDMSEAEQAEAGGHTVTVESLTPNKAGKDMAKKAAKLAPKNGKKEKPAKTVRACACGCGGETTGFFVPGHDARMHGWIKKLADGRLDPKDGTIPKSVITKLGLVATKTGFKATNPHFWTDAA